MGSAVEEFILSHAAAPYDPVKRHQYYEEHKKLKGRRTGTSTMPSGGGSRGGTGTGPRLHSQANQQASEARNAARISAIRSRLTELRAHLQELLAQAAKEDAASSSTSTSSSKSGGSSSTDKPMTAKEKADARKASQRYRDKHKNDTPDKPAEPTIGEQVAKVRATIQRVEDNLRAALEQARNQTATGR